MFYTFTTAVDCIIFVRVAVLFNKAYNFYYCKSRINKLTEWEIGESRSIKFLQQESFLKQFWGFCPHFIVFKIWLP